MTIREHIAEILGMKVYDVLDWCTFGELGLDSLDVADLAFQLEKRLDVSLRDGSWEKCRSIGDVVRLVERSQNDGAISVGYAPVSGSSREGGSGPAVQGVAAGL